MSTARLACVALVAGLVATGACRPFTDHDSIEHVAVELSEVLFWRVRLDDNGVLLISGTPRDTRLRLGENQRVPVHISTSRGDEETLLLSRQYCPYREYAEVYDCFLFVVVTQPGASVAPLDSAARRAGARAILSASGSVVGVIVFDRSHLLPLAREARSWPGVGATALNQLQGCGDQPCDWGLYKSIVAAPIAVSMGATQPNDDIVQIAPGDTIIASHSASGVSSRVVVP